MVIHATYVSVWDGGDTEIRTACKWDTEKRVAFDVESVDVQGVELLDREYVELGDGTEVAVDSRLVTEAGEIPQVSPEGQVIGVGEGPFE